MSTNIVTVRGWNPAPGLRQSLGDDGAESGEKLVWSDVVAEGLNDGEGNKISMTEAIQLLLKFKASQEG